MQLRKINLCDKGKIFPDDIFIKKSQQYFYLNVETAKLFESFLCRIFMYTWCECMCIHSSDGAVHVLNDGPRQIETVECRSN